ncbi:MAG: cytochrome c maturation protein CcmE domain-containing protein [Acidimicrobiales bacterium]
MTSTETAPDLSPVAPPPSKNRSRRRSIAVLAVLVLAVLALLSQGLLHSLNYFETVSEVFAHRSSVGTEVIRLEGVVAPGSIKRSSNGATFVLTGSKDQRVYVDAHGSPPQLFQANIPVVVVGHFTSATSRTFDGTQIMVKHSASYIAAHPSRVKAPNGSSR